MGRVRQLDRLSFPGSLIREHEAACGAGGEGVMLLSGYSPSLMKFILSWGRWRRRWPMRWMVTETWSRPAARWILVKPCGAS
jgi:hypothetical protein